MNALLLIVAALALLPALNTFVDLYLLRTPAPSKGSSSVAILIPARNEEANIGACVDAALASVGVDVEVVVLDDGSTDRTRAIVEERVARDPRLRIVTGPPLPRGWMGKSHACHILAQSSEYPFLLFVDADVRISPEAAMRLLPPKGVDLVSCIPHQITEGLVETSVIPMINSLIFGYLPLAPMRKFTHPALAAACGQVMMVRASAYRKCGGHAAISGFLHDGMQLARLFRRQGRRTDLADGTSLAECRMYDSSAAVLAGFSKNAIEGMARPVALPIWTILLVGGHLLPLILAAALVATGAQMTLPSVCLFAATALLILARTLQAIKCRESALAVLLHPIGVVMTLAIQWAALYRSLRGGRVQWRGRTYANRL